MNKIILTATLSLFMLISTGASADKKGTPIGGGGVTCDACVGDGGLGYQRQCCENRTDPIDGTSYQYCVTASCLPGQGNPDKLKFEVFGDEPLSLPPKDTIVTNPNVTKAK